jgi:formiminotetrahydrofolate cyclodeaminase
MDGETIGSWLDALASSAPAPGGGAAAALEAAMAAALLEMVCNLTIGRPAYADHDETTTSVRDRATTLRADALGLAQEDADAFSAVIAAYKLPRETPEEAEARGREIQRALVAAAEVARSTADVAMQILDLVETVVPIGNVNVISDGAAAAGAARAAIQTSLVNIDANVASIADPETLATFVAFSAAAGERLDSADGIVAAVRARSSSG